MKLSLSEKQALYMLSGKEKTWSEGLKERIQERKLYLKLLKDLTKKVDKFLEFDYPS